MHAPGLFAKLDIYNVKLGDGHGLPMLRAFNCSVGMYGVKTRVMNNFIIDILSAIYENLTVFACSAHKKVLSCHTPQKLLYIALA